MPEILKIGLPKGSLQAATFELFKKAGYRIDLSSRSYRPQIDDPEVDVRLIRAQEIGRYVDHGYLDCGITGKDWILENRARVETLCDRLPYSKATRNPTRWVIAVPEDSPIQEVRDLEGKTIATEAVRLTTDFLEARGVRASVEFSWGATEVKAPDLVDAVVDVTETGSSLRANRLRILETIMESWPRFIMNPASFRDGWKREKAGTIRLMLLGVIEADAKVGIKMNVRQKQLQNLLRRLPSLRHPTISPLADPSWVSVETVLEESVVREIVPRLKACGAEGLIEYPLNKIIL